MSKIIKNGIVYGETLLPAAGNIAYDNTASGLNATTMQNAITELKDMYDLPKGYAWAGTQTEWDNLTVQEKAVYDGKIIAIIGDDSVLADDVVYDNTDSGMTSDNVQDAIDELKDAVEDKDAQPTQDSAKVVTSDGIYRHTAGQKEYVSNALKGEIFNSYGGNGKNIATGDRSHAEGYFTQATGQYSHAEGYANEATAATAHAEGNNTIASGEHSHTEGFMTEASGVASHAEGSNTVASAENAHTEGQLTEVYSESGHAEGNSTKVGSAVINSDSGATTYTGTNAKYAHAEGYNSVAAAQAAHAEGGYTVASNEGSHAEGASTVASGQYSHAEGVRAEAAGFASHASGIHTIANTSASTVVGRYNVLDGTGENDPKHLFIIGNGTDNNARSNIVEVSSTELNVNGDIKKNGVALGSLAMKDTDDIHREMSDVDYAALPASEKNNGTEYLVYETSEDNRSIVCKDANGNFKYRAFVYGVIANGSPGWNKSATDSDAPTTPPTKVNPQISGTSLIWGFTTSEKTIYFNRFTGNAPNGSNASDKDASNIGFALTGNVNTQYSLTKNGTAWITANFVETLSTDVVTLGKEPTGNRYIKAYDKSYGDMSDLGALAYKDTASGTAVTTVGTLPALTYDSTTESFTFSAGTLPTTGTVTVS